MFRNRVLLVVSLLLALTLSVSGESFEDGYLYHGPEGRAYRSLSAGEPRFWRLTA